MGGAGSRTTKCQNTDDLLVGFERHNRCLLGVTSPILDDSVPSTMENPSERELQNGIQFDPEKLGLETIGPEQEQSNGTVPSLDTARLEDDKLEPIAVIGFAARLPQDATTPEKFWQMLCEGRSARTEIPQDRFNVDAFYHPDPDRIDAVSLNAFFCELT